jgi:hypothetical protein
MWITRIAVPVPITLRGNVRANKTRFVRKKKSNEVQLHHASHTCNVVLITEATADALGDESCSCVRQSASDSCAEVYYGTHCINTRRNFVFLKKSAISAPAASRQDKMFISGLL